MRKPQRMGPMPAAPIEKLVMSHQCPFSRKRKTSETSAPGEGIEPSEVVATTSDSETRSRRAPRVLTEDGRATGSVAVIGASSGLEIHASMAHDGQGARASGASGLLRWLR